MERACPQGNTSSMAALPEGSGTFPNSAVHPQTKFKHKSLWGRLGGGALSFKLQQRSEDKSLLGGMGKRGHLLVRGL